MAHVVFQLVIGGLAMGAVYALVALGFTLIWNAVGIVNFAQGDVVMLGAYVVVGWCVDTWHLPIGIDLAGHAGLHGGLRPGLCHLRLSAGAQRAAAFRDRGDARPRHGAGERRRADLGAGAAGVCRPARQCHRRDSRCQDLRPVSADPGGAAAADGAQEGMFRFTSIGRAMRATAQDAGGGAADGHPHAAHHHADLHLRLGAGRASRAGCWRRCSMSPPTWGCGSRWRRSPPASWAASAASPAR